MIKMSIVKNFKDLTNDLRLNKNVGTFAWLLHRITGLMLALYIFMHLCVIGSEFFAGKGAFNSLMGSFEIPILKFLEYCLIGVIGFHLINGLRIIIADFFILTRRHKIMFWIGMMIFLAVMAITFVAFLSKMLS